MFGGCRTIVTGVKAFHVVRPTVRNVDLFKAFKNLPRQVKLFILTLHSAFLSVMHVRLITGKNLLLLLIV